MKRRHALSSSVEGNFRNAGRCTLQNVLVIAGGCCGSPQGHFGRISAEPAIPIRRRIVVLRERLRQQGPGTVTIRCRLQPPHQTAVRIHPFHGHLVLRKCAGLVGADEGDGAERLDGGKTPDERILPHHIARAESQRHSHDCGQRFGNRRHREADSGQEHEHGGFAAQQPGRENQRTDGQHDQCEALPEARQALLKRGLGDRVFAQQSRDATELGGHSRGDRDAESTTGGGQRPLVRHVVAL